MNLEIQGIVKQEGEVQNDVLGNLGTPIGKPIVESDIECCHRVRTKASDKSNIIVRFKSCVKRDAALKKAKKAQLTKTWVSKAQLEYM